MMRGRKRVSNPSVERLAWVRGSNDKGFVYSPFLDLIFL